MEVLSELRARLPADHFLVAGEQITHGALGVQPGERLLVVYEIGFENLASAVVRAADAGLADVDAIALAEPLGPVIVDRLVRRTATCDVSVFIADFSFPREVRTVLTQVAGTDRRHAHMLGVSDAVVRQSLRADYHAVHALGERLISLLRRGGIVQVATPSGTDLQITSDPRCRWYNQGGLQHSPGWTNLPAGEVVTCPESVDGTFVPDGGVVLTDGTIIERVDARRLALRFEGGRLMEVEGPASARDALLQHVDSRENARRVGQLSFGTNIDVLTPIGNPGQDVKQPGVHLVLGYSAPDVTGARWNGKAMVQLLQRQEKVSVDGQLVIDRGRYVGPIAKG